MHLYTVTMHGDAREVYVLEASSPEEARENWSQGELVVSENSSMEFYSVTQYEGD